MVNSSHRHGAKALAEGVRALYREGQTDYSLEPILLVDGQDQPIGRIVDGDTVIFCCKRGEREIQLTEAFTEVGFDRFSHPAFQNLTFAILTLYHQKFKDLPVAFAPVRVSDTLGEVVSRAQLRQLRVAESEKFAHVTFFFNGGENQPFAGEEDVSIPSLSGFPLDQVPELSLSQVADQVIRGMEQGYELIVTNFANGDVIGHTHNCQAKRRCAEWVDQHLGRVINSALTADYVVLVTADHGNLEVMVNADGTSNGSHTSNPVPFLLIDPRAHLLDEMAAGKLADIAPTILQLLDVEKPDSMIGASLIQGCEQDGPRRVLLIILDGWGIGKQDGTNPIYLAQTPVWDDLTRRYPSTQLQAAGEAVGLKRGKAGNSEAGHMNIGAGRIVPQDDARIDLAMREGSFYTNPTLCNAIEEVRERNTSLHLIGLLTEKSSHGSIEYPLALLKMAKARGVEKVCIHVIFDGRSTEPGTAPAMLEKLERQIEEIGMGQIVTGVGRAYALDRGGNYAKTQRAYDAFVSGVGKKCVLK